ncbi:hypothetical protein L1987_15074 [Smallanthus sonchifolius]|uniref:Uncharacterized protein n=1 Tax=Smallanthus sonchifolius TaxID=185202 RepID=A0ACB9J4X5_9ASTR|nr:hypothetical protein L1987_15074 [Smallanthus sonchifolius]
MEKSRPTRFTKPEMEAALHLIQLSGESDGGGFSNSSGEVLSTSMKRRKEFACDHDEIQGSSTTDVTSGPGKIVVPEDDKDVAGSMRGKRKKFRSIVAEDGDNFVR